EDDHISQVYNQEVVIEIGKEEQEFSILSEEEGYLANHSECEKDKCDGFGCPIMPSSYHDECYGPKIHIHYSISSLTKHSILISINRNEIPIVYVYNHGEQCPRQRPTKPRQRNQHSKYSCGGGFHLRVFSHSSACRWVS